MRRIHDTQSRFARNRRSIEETPDVTSPSQVVTPSPVPAERSGWRGRRVGDALNRAIVIRRAEASDALCIGALGTQVFLDTYATHGIRPALALEVAETLSTSVVAALIGKPGATFLVAELKDHMIGFAQLTANAEHSRVLFSTPTELNRLYVQERFTGCGIGKALLRRAEIAACENGASGVWLAAWSGNARALGFYASRGYADLGAVPFTVQGERYENRLFAKRLDAEGW
jgi:GNAT superfamily N-acetyltransferase